MFTKTVKDGVTTYKINGWGLFVGWMAAGMVINGMQKAGYSKGYAAGVSEVLKKIPITNN